MSRNPKGQAVLQLKALLSRCHDPPRHAPQTFMQNLAVLVPRPIRIQDIGVTS